MSIKNNEKFQCKIVSGTKIAQNILQEVAELVSSKKIKPHFAIILVGNNKSSQIYVNKKMEAAKKSGVKVTLVRSNSNIAQGKLENIISSLNNDPQIGSVIIQLPLPKHIDTNKAIKSLLPSKDLDGFHPENLKNKRVIPIIGEAVLEVFSNINFYAKGKKVAIITKESPLTQGLGKIFHDGETVVQRLVYPRLTLNQIKNEARKADVIITALGKAKYLNDNYVKDGAVIIDIGIARKNNKICGDVDFERVVEKASFITPVPGGVGPITVACAIRKAVSLYINNCK